MHAANIVFKLEYVDIEPGSADGICDYDYLEIMDGTPSSGSRIAIICNTLPPAVPSYTTGPDGTIVFFSNAWVSLQGFKMTWQCNLNNSKPIANFSSKIQSTCDGRIQFEDQSLHLPTGWNWNFGDGESSNLQNPEHLYKTNGKHTVQLIVSNTYGSDTFTRTEYIEVDNPVSPVLDLTSNQRCNAGILNMNATGMNTIHWYDSLSSKTSISSGSSFTTPSLSSSRDYFIESKIANLVRKVGPLDTSFSDGGIIDFGAYMIFDCYKACVLKNVTVYADSGRARKIYLKDNFGKILRDTLIFIQGGKQTVHLNFDIPVGKDYKLGIIENSNLFRNNDGNTNYPYIDPDSTISIKTSSAGDCCYYYFYDWQIQRNDCVSPRVKVNAEIHKPFLGYIGDTHTCMSNPIRLQPSNNYEDSVYWHNLQQGADSIWVNPTILTNYYYTLSNKCGVYNSFIKVKPIVHPFENVNQDTTICMGSSIVLSTKPSDSLQMVSWSPNNFSGQGDVRISVSPLSNTVYYGQVTNKCGTFYDTVDIALIEDPKAKFTFQIEGLKLILKDSSINTSSILWNFGDGTDSREKSPVKVYSKSGEYKVAQIGMNRCKADTLALIIKLESGSSNISGSSGIRANLYPNPILDNLNIDLLSMDLKEVLLIITDSYGRKIIEKSINPKSIHTENLSKLASGTYNLNLTDNKKLNLNYKLLKM